MAIVRNASEPASAPKRSASLDFAHGSALGRDSHSGAPASAQRRDRWALAGGFAALFAASWAWLIYQHSAMRHMDIVEMAMPSIGLWSAGDVLLILVMWVIMMVAMMLPSALPMLLIYRRVVASRGANALPGTLTVVLAAGYLSAWVLFSIIATLAQWALHTPALISPMMVVSPTPLGGVLLIAAGIYQWTPLKHACLAHCRSPLTFLTTHWRGGARGAFVIGVRHGFYCTGCCWLLMAILFVAGVMNIAWIVVLTTLVIAEKVLPKGEWIARAAGIAIIVWGGYLLAR